MRAPSLSKGRRATHTPGQGPSTSSGSAHQLKQRYTGTRAHADISVATDPLRLDLIAGRTPGRGREEAPAQSPLDPDAGTVSESIGTRPGPRRPAGDVDRVRTRRLRPLITSRLPSYDHAEAHQLVAARQLSMLHRTTHPSDEAHLVDFVSLVLLTSRTLHLLGHLCPSRKLSSGRVSIVRPADDPARSEICGQARWHQTGSALRQAQGALRQAQCALRQVQGTWKAISSGP